MSIENLKSVKIDDRGAVYDCDKLIYIIRYKGTVSANHTHEDGEILYLLHGEMDMTIGQETTLVRAPAKITIPPNLYHRVVALTDIEFLENRIKS